MDIPEFIPLFSEFSELPGGAGGVFSRAGAGRRAGDSGLQPAGRADGEAVWALLSAIVAGDRGADFTRWRGVCLFAGIGGTVSRAGGDA